jgi:hypothetical protein
MVEFTLVFPVLAILLFGVIQFGIAFNNYLALTDAVRAGSRQASVARYLPDTQRQSKVESKVRASASNLTQSKLKVFVTPTSNWDPGSDVTVRATYPYSISFARSGREDRDALELDDGACGMTRHKRSSGQAYVISILFLAVLSAMAAAVLDIGFLVPGRPKPAGDGGRGRARPAPRPSRKHGERLGAREPVRDEERRRHDERDVLLEGVPERHDQGDRFAAGSGLLLQGARHQVRDRACDRNGARRLSDEADGSCRSSWTRNTRSSSATRTRAPARPSSSTST